MGAVWGGEGLIGVGLSVDVRWTRELKPRVTRFSVLGFRVTPQIRQLRKVSCCTLKSKTFLEVLPPIPVDPAPAIIVMGHGVAFAHK